MCAQVQEALDAAAIGRTVLVIAHRLSTVQSAHSVAVIDHGCVVELGMHEQLVQTQGPYAQLVRRQLVDSTAGKSEVTTATSVMTNGTAVSQDGVENGVTTAGDVIREAGEEQQDK